MKQLNSIHMSVVATTHVCKLLLGFQVTQMPLNEDHGKETN